MTISVDFSSPTFDPMDYMPRTIAYKSFVTMADGFDAYCAPCGDFYVFECPNECGGNVCVCCMDACETCGATVVFG